MSHQNHQKPVRRGRGFTYSLIMLPIRRKIFSFIFKLIGISITVSLIFLLLSGVINQVKTGQTLVNYALDVGLNISNFFNSLLSKSSPFKINKDGIYFKDADVPQKSLFEDKSSKKLNDWKEAWSLPSGKTNREGIENLDKKDKNIEKEGT